MLTHGEPRLCSLEAAVGDRGVCPEDSCPFWEAGGAVLDGRCAFEQVDVARDVPLAAWLLEIRERLEAAGSAADPDALRRLYNQLLNDASE
jgi:hypothetical protein